MDVEKTSTIPAKKSNFRLADNYKIEKKSTSDSNTFVNDEYFEEQTVKSEAETQNQDNIALKLKSVKNSLDHTNAELEKGTNHLLL